MLYTNIIYNVQRGHIGMSNAQFEVHDTPKLELQLAIGKPDSRVGYYVSTIPAFPFRKVTAHANIFTIASLYFGGRPLVGEFRIHFGNIGS